MTKKQINKCYWNLNSNFNEFSKIELIMQDTVKIKNKKRTIVVYILADDFASTSKQKNQYSRVFFKKVGRSRWGTVRSVVVVMCFYKQITEVLYSNSQFLE